MTECSFLVELSL